MNNLTIQNFWKRRLTVQRPATGGLVRGWSTENDGLSAFMEAPLAINTELSCAGDEDKGSILLVSAPGAVGKSTLARQIAFETGAVYIDLAKTDPVGGNTLSGGLVKSGLYSSWQNQTTAVLIDGLDEARFRVTQEAFEVFLSDVAQLANDRKVPTVLFGRTGAIQDAWLLLGEAKPAVLEIGYYGTAESVEFAYAQLRALKPESQHADVEREAIKVLLGKLRVQTESDGDRFAGYAPVLQAVAGRVAAVGNAAALVAEIQKGEKPVTLQTVVTAILDRERSKLGGLQFENSRLNGFLYSADEQLDRLVARVYRLKPPALPAMSAKDASTYATALESWVSEHPFLDGRQGTSSAVFEAVIATHALRTPAAADEAALKELQRGAAANPFLAEFYIPDNAASHLFFIPSEHIGIVYASLRSRLSLGDTASLLIDAPNDSEDEQSLKAEVEVVLSRRDYDRPRILNFESSQIGTLQLGAYVDDVEIDAPHARVAIGPGPEAVLVAPVSIQCSELLLTTEKVIAELATTDRAETAIYLEAERYVGDRMLSVPISRGKVSLSASWPGVKNHPWTNAATEPAPVEDPRINEALRRFRKFVIAFRSHSKGNLARYKHKIEHARMTKGTGAAVLNLLIAEGLLTLNGSMYFLDPVRLGEVTGASYADCMSRQFSTSTINFISRALT